MHTFRAHPAPVAAAALCLLVWHLAPLAAITGPDTGPAAGAATDAATSAATGEARVGEAKAAKAATHTVSIEATSFQPQTLTVKAGDSVVWVNKDPFPHTATSQTAGFDSHAIAPGKSWTYVARKKGDFAYVCMLHPTMKATLRVE
jgi:plastocyanin